MSGNEVGGIRPHHGQKHVNFDLEINHGEADSAELPAVLQSLCELLRDQAEEQLERIQEVQAKLLAAVQDSVQSHLRQNLAEVKDVVTLSFKRVFNTEEILKRYKEADPGRVFVLKLRIEDIVRS